MLKQLPDFMAKLDAFILIPEEEGSYVEVELGNMSHYYWKIIYLYIIVPRRWIWCHGEE